MNRLSISIAALLIVFATICIYAPSAPAAGLYGNEGKDIKSGDISSQDYWWTKFDMMMLDLALKQRQPEGKIGLQLVSTEQRIDGLIKEYPKHEELKEWKKKVHEIQGKIDPNASRTEAWKSGCPWEESNFAQLWVNLHWSKMLAEQKDYEKALGLMQNVRQNYEVMMKPDRMKDYPEELRKWVEDNKPEADKFYAELKEKTRR